MKSFRKLLLITLILSALAVLAACSSSSASSSTKPVDVNVTLTEFKIDSSVIDFQQGVPYHFIVTNKGSVAHEFLISPPLSDQVTSEDAQKQSLVSILSDKLTSGATVTADYTFAKAYPAGSLEMSCHLPGHYDGGMHTPITVK